MIDGLWFTRGCHSHGFSIQTGGATAVMLRFHVSPIDFRLLSRAPLTVPPTPQSHALSVRSVFQWLLLTAEHRLSSV